MMQIKTLNKEKFQEATSLLLSKIDFEVDLIIEILDAGGYLGKIFRKNEKFTKTCFGRVKYQRSNKSIKMLGIVKMIVNILPYGILDKLRNYESQSMKKNIQSYDLKTLENVDLTFSDECYGHSKHFQNILILDDSLDTGKTVYIVKNNLKRLYPESNIKTAVISWTLNQSIVKPDFYIFKDQLIRYPWGIDYKGNDFETERFSG